MAQTIPIYVISLPYSTERKKSITDQMHKLNLNYQIVDAVDGKKLDLDKLEKSHTKKLFQPNPYNLQIMSRGAIGCLLSHLDLYYDILEQGIETACILEDDVQLSDDFPNIINSAVLNDDWEVLSLGHYSMRYRSMEKGADICLSKKHLYGKHYIARPCEFPFLSMGYLIRKSAAYKMREYAYPFRMPIDWVIGNSELAGVSLKMLSPPCVIRNKLFENDSTIEKTIVPDKQKPLSRTDFIYLTLSKLINKRLLNAIFPTLKKSFRLSADFIYNCQRLIIKLGFSRLKYTRDIKK